MRIGTSRAGRTRAGRGARRASAALALGLALSVGTLSTGCRIDENDVHRWASKSQGPRKLVAVLTHDKYPMDLRVEAAMTMVRMKPRGGRHVGIQGNDEFVGLIDALGEVPAEARKQIVAGMVPELEKAIAEKAPEGEPDPTFAAKDAAYALLTTDGGSLVTDPEMKQRLEQALVSWTNTNFAARLDDTSQIYGVEAVLRHLKADGVRDLAKQIKPGGEKLSAISKLVRELGDDKTKLEASKRLVEVAKNVESKAWVDQKAPSVKAANEAAGLKVNEKQFDAQLGQYQEEELLRVFEAMKNVGQKPVVDYLLAYATEANHPEKRRVAALAALEGNLDRSNPAHAKILLDFVSDDSTPDAIRDVASQRVGELSRDQVVDRLYALFDNDRWQVRSIVASLILRMSDAKHIDEFMTRLGKTDDMALSEPLLYGPLLDDVKGATPEDLVSKYAQKGNPAQARLTALGYYYAHGSKADLGKVKPFGDDTQKVPKCGKDAQNCDWQCAITEDGKRVMKEVATVGEFVRYCIEPALSAREPKEEPKADKASSGEESGKK